MKACSTTSPSVSFVTRRNAGKTRLLSLTHVNLSSDRVANGIEKREEESAGRKEVREGRKEKQVYER